MTIILTQGEVFELIASVFLVGITIFGVGVMVGIKDNR